MLYNPPHAEQRHYHEPEQHDRPHHLADARCALLLYGEQRDEDPHGRRQHVTLHVRRYDVQPF
jgi:hypothetical protein